MGIASIHWNSKNDILKVAGSSMRKVVRLPLVIQAKNLMRISANV